MGTVREFSRRTGLRWSLVCVLFWVALCAPAFSQTGDVTLKQLDYNGAKRSYYEHVPSSYDSSSSSVPLVIFLHGSVNGRTATVEGAAKLSGWTTRSDEKGFIAVYPVGGIAVANGTSSPGYKWNTYVFDGKTPDDVGYLLAVINQLKNTYRIDANRIYMTGHSSGGAMVNTFIGNGHASLIAASAPVSGPWITTFRKSESLMEPGGPIPVWIWRGEEEDQITGTIPRDIQDEDQKQFWIQYNQTDQSQRTVSGSYVTDVFTGGNAEVRFTEVTGAGHLNDDDYSLKIWNEFFSRLTLADRN
ncbi:MAG: hypothetical protein KME03_02535 [Aphanocapsa lilacina HA4352-LM1]|jgi:poly(3-hydroxybutyrate) depolymerase|nr:hypothetical protein [Aphanocapsa lilacina HA4352-LM1]